VIDWEVRQATLYDIPRIQALTEMHKGDEMPYTLSSSLTAAFLGDILVVEDSLTGEIGCFEHIIQAPFDVKDRVFLKGIKQFPYIDQVKWGELVNCCQSAGLGKGSHRAMYRFQKENWPVIWTWISVRSVLWPVLKDEGWKIVGEDKFFNIWKGAESTFLLGKWEA